MSCTLPKYCRLLGILGGSCVALSGVYKSLIWVISVVTLLITPRITTHEAPSLFPEA